MGEETSLALTTLDHYLPMIYAIALQEKDETLKFIYEGFQHDSISMRCFQIDEIGKKMRSISYSEWKKMGLLNFT
jgi:hypothetical protein